MAFLQQLKRRGKSALSRAQWHALCACLDFAIPAIKKIKLNPDWTCVTPGTASL
jgi:uncharacterized protein YcbK (DUF882 family)